MIQSQDQESTGPKAFVFKSGEAHFWDYPANDNGSAKSIGSKFAIWILLVSLICAAGYFLW